MLKINPFRWVRNRKEKKWIRENSNKWIQGKWLHIHVKNNNTVQVGWVDIEQNYQNIRARGRNYDAKEMSLTTGSIEDWERTEWQYVDAQINYDPSFTRLYLLGLYYTVKIKHGNDKEYNYGMHRLIIEPGGEMKEPVAMYGSFGDVYTLEHEIGRSCPSCGHIQMYRISKAMERELYKENGSFDPKILSSLISGEIKLEDEICKRYVSNVKTALDHTEMRNMNQQNREKDND